MISVIVPVYDEERNIASCLGTLSALEPPEQGFEIIVVDNNSNDGTRDIVQRYAVTMTSEVVAGSPAARNRGMAIARGEILAFTDADCRVGPDWARQIEASMQDERVDAVQGYAAGINENLHAEFAQRRWEESRFVRTAQGLVLKYRGIDTRNCAVRRRAFDVCGRFDPQIPYCGDLEFSIRLNQARCKISFNPEMLVWHKNPTSFAEILDKSRNQLDSVLRILKRHPKVTRPQDMPFPTSAFYGLADRDLPGATGALVLASLWVLRSGIFAVTRVLMGLRIGAPWVFKLYKLFFGISYEIALIQARRAGARR